MIYIKRNNQEFGPYDETTLLTYVNSGQILKTILHEIVLRMRKIL